MTRPKQASFSRGAAMPGAHSRLPGVTGWILLRLVRWLGIRHPATTPVAWTLRREWKALVVAIQLAVLLPLFELSIVALLFAVISADDSGLRWYVGRALTEAGITADTRTIALALFGACVIALSLFVATRFLQKRLTLGINIRTYLLYGRVLVASYLNAPPRLHQQLNRNEFASALYEELWVVAALVYSVVGAASSVISALILLGGAFLVSPPIAGGAVAMAGIVGLLFRTRYRRHREITQEKFRVLPELLGRVMDVLDGYRSIRLAAAEDAFADRLSTAFKRNTGWRAAFVHNQTFLATLSQALVYVLMLVVVAIAVLVTTDLGGTVLVILVLMQRTLASLGQLQQDWIKVQQGATASEKVFGLLERCREHAKDADVDDAATAPEPVRTVSCEAVSFSYPGGSRIYDQLDLHLAAGDRVLVQGPSGMGKSTLGLLVCGLLEPQSGQVRINERPLDERSFRRLRSGICYVSPDMHVFDAPLRDNVFLAGNGDGKTYDAVIEAAQLQDVAGRHGDGDQRRLGKNGETLSLGERQRLLLAQAFVKRPSLLVLDEATANLDLELENAVLARLVTTLPEDAILLVIAHKRPRRLMFTREYSLQDGRLHPLPVAGPVTMP